MSVCVDAVETSSEWLASDTAASDSVGELGGRGERRLKRLPEGDDALDLSGRVHTREHLEHA